MQPLPAKKMEYTYDIDTEGYVRRRKIAAAKRSYTYETDAEGWIKRKSIVLLDSNGDELKRVSLFAAVEDEGETETEMEDYQKTVEENEWGFWLEPSEPCIRCGDTSWERRLVCNTKGCPTQHCMDCANESTAWALCTKCDSFVCVLCVHDCYECTRAFCDSCSGRSSGLSNRRVSGRLFRCRECGIVRKAT